MTALLLMTALALADDPSPPPSVEALFRALTPAIAACQDEALQRGERKDVSINTEIADAGGRMTLLPSTSPSVSVRTLSCADRALASVELPPDAAPIGVSWTLWTGGAPELRFGRPTDAGALGALPKSQIDDEIRSHMNQIRYCYQRELVTDPSLAGLVKMVFVISPDGSVETARPKLSTLPGDALPACLTERMLAFQFPEPKGGGKVIVTYPFIFAPEQDAPLDEELAVAARACVADVQPLRGAHLMVAIHYTRRRPDRAKLLLADEGAPDVSGCLLEAVRSARSKTAWTFHELPP